MTEKVRGEVHADPEAAERREKELGLGVKETEDPAPGMPSAQGGGLTSEAGHSHPETDPDS
jgi:hypothetical protein